MAISDESGALGALHYLDPALTTTGTQAAKKDRNQIGKDEFLHMLVTQLKNQDPMDPMKDDQFAVNLAQFSQVEQLININDTLKAESASGAGISSLAGYLGHRVVMDGNSVDVVKGSGGGVEVDLTQDASEVNLTFKNSDGKEVGTYQAGALGKGQHLVKLDNLSLDDGTYTIEVAARSTSGQPLVTQAHPAGVVTGFVPGSDPSLLMDDREVKPGQVIKVVADQQ